MTNARRKHNLILAAFSFIFSEQPEDGATYLNIVNNWAGETRQTRHIDAQLWFPALNPEINLTSFKGFH
jgi:hypothetical protein